MQLPTVPNGSLYGGFPPFPTRTYSWGVNIAYHFYGFKINLPNFGAIPTWILQIFEWLFGWFGAYFYYGLVYAADYIINTIQYIIGVIFGIFDSIIGTMQELTAGAGIWAIPIDMVIAGLMLVAIVFVIFGIVKIAGKIAGGI